MTVGHSDQFLKSCENFRKLVIIDKIIVNIIDKIIDKHGTWFEHVSLEILDTVIYFSLLSSALS